MFYIQGNYQECSVCGGLADDGGLRNNKFTCHDCLEKTCLFTSDISRKDNVLLVDSKKDYMERGSSK